MIALDTDTLVRFLVEEDGVQTKRASALFGRAEASSPPPTGPSSRRRGS
jgi:predicted nucleic-acid-binding protein